MRRRSRVLAIASISLLLGTGSVVATTAAAQALPSGCTAFVATDGRGYAKCTSGTGYYKVGIACKPVGPFGQYGFGFTHQGNWARVGGVYQSVAKCPPGTSNWSPSGNGVFYAWIDQTAENI